MPLSFVLLVRELWLGRIVQLLICSKLLRMLESYFFYTTLLDQLQLPKPFAMLKFSSLPSLSSLVELHELFC